MIHPALACGFSSNLVIGVYIGYDNPKTLGRYETGSKAALPVFKDFIENALYKEDFSDFEIPENIHVKFSVLDRDEKEVLIIHEGDLKAGSHVYLFNSKDMKNGDYFLNFVSEYQSINKKMIIQN